MSPSYLTTMRYRSTQWIYFEITHSTVLQKKVKPKTSTNQQSNASTLQALLVPFDREVIHTLNLIWYTFLWGAILMMYKYRDHIKDMKEFEELGDVNLDIRTWGLIAGHVVFWFGFIPLVSLLNIIFSILLIIGISNRRPGQVKIYLAFGVVVTVLGLVAAVVEMALSKDAYPGLFVMFVCALQGLYLLLVYQTYKGILEEPHFDGHKRLVQEDSNFSQVLQRHLNSMDSISDISHPV